MKTRHVLFAVLAISLLYAFAADATAIKGTVSRYDPGHSITVIGADNRSLTFTLAPGAEVSGDIQEGRTVYLVPESDSPSAQIVKISPNEEAPPGINNAYISGVVGAPPAPAANGAGAAATAGPGNPGDASAPPIGKPGTPSSTSAGPETTALVSPGNASAGSGVAIVATGTVVSAPPSNPGVAGPAPPPAKIATVNGVVKAYTPGESLTIRAKNGGLRTFTLTASSLLPSRLSVGQRVEILPGTSERSVAEQVTLARGTRSKVAISNQ